MFYLHSSAEHAFLLTRRSTVRNVNNSSSNNNNESSSSDGAVGCSSSSSSYSFNGSDESVSWDAVRMVKQLVPVTTIQKDGPSATTTTTTNDEPSCPICLCELVCPRITKCGHTFCLSCLLRHVQTYSANNPYHDVKCPCCALPILVSDLRTVIFDYVVPPVVVPANSHPPHYRNNKTQQTTPTIRLRKLHRQKQCSAPYLPVPSALMHSNPHSAPCSSDEDAKFCRFNYIDPTVYLQTLSEHQNQLVCEISSLPPPTAVAATSYKNNNSNSSSSSSNSTDVERLFLNMAMEMVLNQQQNAHDELAEEQTLQQRFAQPTSGMYQPQSPALLYHHQPNNNVNQTTQPKEQHLDGSHSVQTTDSSHTHSSDCNVDYPTSPKDHPGPRLGRYRGDSIGSYTSVGSVHTPVSYQLLEDVDYAGTTFPLSPGDGSVGSQKDSVRDYSAPKTPTRAKTKARTQPYGSMYLNDSDAHHFYQADDGQLVFLNGFNMTCLLSDFTKTKTTELAADSELKPPLPDVIEGKVLEIENVQLTPELRKRMPFLSHIPSYTDISFVELDLFHILSESTRRKFKVDFAKRRKRRISKLQAEKRADKAAEREEMEKINERKARLQTIDPDDEFFRAPTIPEVNELSLTSEDFGPALRPTSIADEVDGFDEVTPALTSSTITFSEACRQGNNDVITISSTEAFPALGTSSAEPFPALGGGTVVKPNPNPAVAAATPTVIQSSVGGKKKKKNKGQKISLFSTGGQRGY
jgi:RING-type zinc-finger